jgi:hypothetical protein
MTSKEPLSMGEKPHKGPQRHSRWTFWRNGFGERKPLICSKCQERVYKLTYNSSKEGLCEKCK